MVIEKEIKMNYKNNDLNYENIAVELISNINSF